MKYGLPYQGSKSAIAEWVVAQMPPAEVFVDLFAGGCAVTHCAMLSGKYKKFVANDITPVPSAFLKAVEFGVEDLRFVSRQDFQSCDDWLTKIIYSFGNNCREYMYSPQNEELARAIHLSVFEHHHEPLSELTGLNIEYYIKDMGWFEAYTLLKKLISQTVGGDGRAVHIERINRIKALNNPVLRQKAKNLLVVQGDYRNLEIPKNSVCYCDIPYSDTAKYHNEFEHQEFYRWCKTQNQHLYISEYKMPDDFTEISRTKKLNQMSASTNFKNTERLFTYNSPIYNDQPSIF